MTIETGRCLIRRFEEKDLEPLMAYRNDEHWMRYQGFKGLTKAEYRKALLGAPDLDAGVQLAVTEKTTGELLGDIYLKREGDVFWIGYTISPLKSRQGYTFETVGAVLDWIKGTDAQEILASTLPENTPSISLLEKLGFEPAGKDEDDDLLFVMKLNGKKRK